MAVSLWLFSSLVLIISMAIFWYSPKVAISPNIVSFDDTMVKSLDGVKRAKWNNAQLLFQGQIIGPDSITHDPVTGNLFTGTSDGLIWKINKDLTNAEIVLRIGEDHQECGSPEYMNICGRVLGLKFVVGDILIVADANMGIISINVSSKTKEILVEPDNDMDTKSLKLFNSVDVSEDGIVYFTVSSMKWTFHDFIYSFMEADSTGRVYSYNLVTRQLQILSSNIAYANGIILSHDGRSLLVAELIKRRILKIDLQDLTVSVFVDNLPGPPDNLKKGSDGSYFVTLPDVGSSRFVTFAYSHPLFNEWSVWLLPKWLFYMTFSFESMVLQLDGEGRIICAIDGNRKEIAFITEAYETNGYIFFGSTFSNHLAVMNKIDMERQ